MPYKFDNQRAWGRHYGIDFGGGFAIPMLLAMGSRIGPPANYAAYSFDGGVTFTNVVCPVAAQWFGGAYSQSLGYGIMISSDGQVVRSFDGITWAALAGENLANRNWQGGVIRNADDSLFVATSLTSGIAATSPDGVTWTERATPAGSYGSVCRLAEQSGKIVACGAGGIIRSLDGGITWGSITSPGDTNSDILTDQEEYLHVVGNTSSNAGDTYFSNNFGTAWTETLRNGAAGVPPNLPQNLNAGAFDNDLNLVYMAGPSGIWQIAKGITNNPGPSGWSNPYPAGVVGSGCRGGYISELGKVIFADTGSNFRTHQRDPVTGVWSTTNHGNLAGAARVRLQFLGFNNPL